MRGSPQSHRMMADVANVAYIAYIVQKVGNELRQGQDPRRIRPGGLWSGSW